MNQGAVKILAVAGIEAVEDADDAGRGHAEDGALVSQSSNLRAAIEIPVGTESEAAEWTRGNTFCEFGKDTGRSHGVSKPRTVLGASSAVQIAIASKCGRAVWSVAIPRVGEAMQGGQSAGGTDLEDGSHVVGAAPLGGAIEVAVRPQGQAAIGILAIESGEVIDRSDHTGGSHFEHCAHAETPSRKSSAVEVTVAALGENSRTARLAALSGAVEVVEIGVGLGSGCAQSETQYRAQRGDKAVSPLGRQAWYRTGRRSHPELDIASPSERNDSSESPPLSLHARSGLELAHAPEDFLGRGGTSAERGLRYEQIRTIVAAFGLPNSDLGSPGWKSPHHVEPGSMCVIAPATTQKMKCGNFLLTQSSAWRSAGLITRNFCLPLPRRWF